MKRRQVVATLLLFICALAGWAQTTRDTPSTPEERKKALTLTKKLEENPMGPDAKEDRRWLTKWIIEIPDITVPVCDETLKPLGVSGEQDDYRYSKELVAQELAGKMAYLIEHPQDARNIKDDDENENYFPVYKAGIESAMNAYEAMVKSGVKGAKWGPMEELVKKRQAGKLDDYIRSVTLKCMTGDTVSAKLVMGNL
jgi:hypothetical protein